MRYFLTILLLFSLNYLNIDAINAQEIDESIDHYVIYNGKQLFEITENLANLTPPQRVSNISERLQKITEPFDQRKLKALTSEFTIDIIYDTLFIMSITPEDATSYGKSKNETAEEYIKIIGASLDEHLNIKTIDNPAEILTFIIQQRVVILKVIAALALLFLLIVANHYLSKLFTKLYKSARENNKKKLKPIVIKGYELINTETVISTTLLILRGIRLSLLILLVYFFFAIVNHLFPWAKASSSIIKSIFLILLTVSITVVLFRVVKIGMDMLKKSVLRMKGTLIVPLRIKTVKLLDEDQIVTLVQKLIFGLQLLIEIFIIYITIPIIFSFFEFSKSWASILFGYILNPLKSAFTSFFGYLPNLFFVGVIIFIVRYVLKLIKNIFRELEHGNIKITNFKQQWSEPTYKIVRTLNIAFAFIIIFPYLPGSQSEAFKGVSLFLGVLFSLGSTAIVANMISGIVLTYTDAFNLGDRIKLGENIGNVIEKTLIVTRIKTNKNVIITIPNSVVLSSHIINYTTSSAGEGLIIDVTVQFGYDVPWRKVRDLLLKAADLTEIIAKEPKPFVLQIDLDDAYTTYELNCYIHSSDKIPIILSELRQNIQDVFHEAGLELVLPKYIALRDGARKGVPNDYLPKEYQAPAFAVKVVNTLSKAGKKGSEAENTGKDNID
ncbi:MAG: mechanosensitive ion channel domain-containing protein [Candidatus Cloacimonas sp.]|nr:mechanosensitive ion channel family protein [Candidatus Cloacimonadota bacterium]